MSDSFENRVNCTRCGAKLTPSYHCVNCDRSTQVKMNASFLVGYDMALAQSDAHCVLIAGQLRSRYDYAVKTAKKLMDWKVDASDEDIEMMNAIVGDIKKIGCDL